MFKIDKVMFLVFESVCVSVWWFICKWGLGIGDLDNGYCFEWVGWEGYGYEKSKV